MNTVKIIGGKWRGKKIQFPSIPGLRPTGSRVKETLFNWLMHDIKGARCLDVFAGSGSLGLEAYSRGAATVVFLEKDRKVFEHLKKLLQGLDASNLHINHINALDYCSQSNLSFDIIFLDPPFANNFLPQLISLIGSTSLLKVNGLLYVESENPVIVDSIQWEHLKQKNAGKVIYSLFKKL